MLLRTFLALTLALVMTVSTVGLLPAQAAPATAGTVIVQLDNPSQAEQNMTPSWIAGWAIDTAATGGPGIDSVMVYIDGDATTGRLLGPAKYGGDRPDVAAQYGNPGYRFSGFVLELAGWNIPLGVTHTFTVVATSRVSGVASAAAMGVTLAPPTNPYMLQPAYGPSNQSGQQYGQQQYVQQYGSSYNPYAYSGSNSTYGSSYNPYSNNGYNSTYGNGYNTNGYYNNAYNTNGYYGNGYNMNNGYSNTYNNGSYLNGYGNTYNNGSYLNGYGSTYNNGSYLSYPTGYGYGSSYPSYSSYGYGSSYPSYSSYGYGTSYPSYGYGSYYGQRYGYPGYSTFK